MRRGELSVLGGVHPEVSQAGGVGGDDAGGGVQVGVAREHHGGYRGYPFGFQAVTRERDDGGERQRERGGGGDDGREGEFFWGFLGSSVAGSAVALCEPIEMDLKVHDFVYISNLEVFDYYSLTTILPPTRIQP